MTNTCPSCQLENPKDAERCVSCGETVGWRLAPGTLVGSRFEILRHLGSGGMGAVYQASDRVLEETVAVKLIRGDWLSPDLARRLRSEIKLARRVTHRNVCRIHDYGEEGGAAFISMEVVDGVEVRRLAREAPGLTTAEAWDIGIQAGEGLAAVHEVGIVHRDFKTANLMRDRRGVVRVMDFGIAKGIGDSATSGLTATGAIVGTPDYMSPEQAHGSPADVRSDVYAFGIVLFEIFTGQVPLRGDTPLATILAHINTAPPLEGPLAVRLPKALVPLMRRLLSKTPAERPQTITDAVAALKAARDQSGTWAAGPLVKSSVADHDDPTATGALPALNQTGPGTTTPPPSESTGLLVPTVGMTAPDLPKVVPAAPPAPLAPAEFLPGSAERRPSARRLAAGVGALLVTAAALYGLRTGPESAPVTPPPTLSAAEVRSLAERLSAPDASRNAAVALLAAQGTPVLAEALLAAERDLARLPGAVEVIEDIARSLKVTEEAFRREFPPATYPLARILQLAKKGLPSATPAIRQAAADLLGTLEAAAAPVAPEIARRLMAEADPKVRLALIEALEEIGPPAAAQASVLRPVLKTGAGQERVAAASALLALGPDDATLATLAEAVETETDGPVRRRIVATISHATLPAAAAPLLAKPLARLLGDGDPETRASAAAALGRLGSGASEAEPRLTEVARADSDASVRTAAARALRDVRVITHEPAACLVEGRHPLFTAQIEPRDQVEEARIYFRSGPSGQLYFIDMRMEQGVWKVWLPKPSMNNTPVAYYLSARLRGGLVKRTPLHTTAVVESASDCATGGTVAPEGFPPPGLTVNFAETTD